MAGADAVLGEQVEVGAAVHVLVPVAAVVFQADKADLAAGGAGGESCAGALALADFIEVLGDLEDLELYVIDGWWVKEDAAVGVDDVFLVDDFLDFDDLLELFFLAATDR